MSTQKDSAEQILAITGRLLAKIENLSTDNKKLEAENASLKEKLAVVQANAQDVWFWQGDGKDDIKTLVCPVVMSAHTLMKIMEGK